MKHRNGYRPARTGVITALTVAALLAGACGGDSDEPASGDDGAGQQDEGDIVRGGNLTVIQTTDTGTFDPTKQGTLSGQGNVNGPVYEGFIYLDNETGEPKPIVTELTGSDDQMTWTFEIVDPDIQFSDGTPFDSEAIKATFDYHAQSDTSQGKGLATLVESWDTSDPMVAVATLSQPNSVFPIEVVTRIGYPLSPTALEQFGDDYGTSPETTVGLGPFVVESYARDSQIVYAKNPNYWQDDKPYLDTVTVRFIPDPNTALNTLVTGDAQAYAAPSQAIDSQAEQQAGLVSKPYYYNSVTFHPIYFFNLQRPPFDDLTARQAAYACLDPEAVAAAAQRPVATAIHETDSPWYSDNGTFPEYNPEQCQELIDEWSANNGGAPLEFTVTDITGNSTLGGQGETIQAAFSEFDNVQVSLREVTLEQQAELPATGDWQLYASATGGVDPTQAYQSAYITDGARNFGGYSNPEMDEALLHGVTTDNDEERKQDYDTVQEILMTDLPTWFMPIVGYSADHYWVSERLQNWDGGQWTGPLVSQIWLSEG